MITSLSEPATFTTVSVGQEIRVRNGHKSGTGYVQHPLEDTIAINKTDSVGNTKNDGTFTKEEARMTVERLLEVLKHVEPRVELSVEDDLNQVIFRVVDKESGELIRQIPPERIVELERFLSDLSGLFVAEDV
jgi:flagellar protein FlaG